MDKPRSISVKDFLIRKMSVKILLPEYVLDAIISHQFQSANKAMLTNNSVELSGFGKFLFNEKKAIKKLEKYYILKENYERISSDDSLPEHKRATANVKLKNVLSYIEILKPKINVPI